MSGIQMLLVLFAVVLFSTIMLTTYNNLFEQMEIAYKGNYLLQGQKIVDGIFQRINVELLSNNINFSNLSTFCNSLSDSIQISYGGSDYDTYYCQINTAYCDSIGDTSNPTADFQEVSIVMYTLVFGVNDTLHIGTSANPIIKVVNDAGI